MQAAARARALAVGAEVAAVAAVVVADRAPPFRLGNVVVVREAAFFRTAASVVLLPCDVSIVHAPSFRALLDPKMCARALRVT